MIDDFHTAMGMVLLRDGINDINTGRRSRPRHACARICSALNDGPSRPSPSRCTHDLPAAQYGLAQMWSGDIVNAVSTTCPKGHVVRRPALLVPARRPRHGRQRPDGDAGSGRQPGRGAPLHQLHARRRELDQELRLHRLPAPAEVASARNRWSRTATYRPTSRAPPCCRSTSPTGYRLLELPPTTDTSGARSGRSSRPMAERGRGAAVERSWPSWPLPGTGMAGCLLRRPAVRRAARSCSARSIRCCASPCRSGTRSSGTPSSSASCSSTSSASAATSVRRCCARRLRRRSRACSAC